MSTPLAHVFGVRHFSPAGALHLRRFLEEIDPDVVLVEGPADALGMLTHLADPAARPPVALLAFTKERPVRSIVYPLASYSPEWIALRFAHERGRVIRLIDLPASVFLAMTPAQAADTGEDHTRAYLDDPYEAIARICGDPDHETWWERHFEHTVEVGAYRDAILELGRGLRGLPRRSLARERETLVRESYMRRQIAAAAPDPSRAVVVCGAYHAPVLTDGESAMTDAELAALPKVPSVLSLMPYSYLRLASQSGYGAGNRAPAYFDALHQEASARRPGRLAARILSEVADRMRRDGLVRSPAEVIEAVRLAGALAAMSDSPAPVLRDICDAAITALGQGAATPVERALFAVTVGVDIGTLPEGVSRTALQENFHRRLRELKLHRYLADEERQLELDLRENRFVKNRESAFLDRNRSTFLHRLAAIGVDFATLGSRDQRGSAKERWLLRWTPTGEMKLAECSLQADSVEGGAAFALAQALENAKDVGDATAVVLRASDCELADALSVALVRVQSLAVDEEGFVASATGVEHLMDVIRYGTVRDIDPAPLRPILAQLYLRATLLLFDACACDDEAARAISAAMGRVQGVAFLETHPHPADSGTPGESDSVAPVARTDVHVDPRRWVDALRTVAQSDARNPFLSGFAAALLIERGVMDDVALDREVARRLSPGADASLGIGWFEGLVQRNRPALFLRQDLWASLSTYVDALDGDPFRRALLYLRRAFASFAPGEVRRAVSILAASWTVRAGRDVAAAIEEPLDDGEIDQLTKDLDGLDI